MARECMSMDLCPVTSTRERTPCLTNQPDFLKPTPARCVAASKTKKKRSMLTQVIHSAQTNANPSRTHNPLRNPNPNHSRTLRHVGMHYWRCAKPIDAIRGDNPKLDPSPKPNSNPYTNPSMPCNSAPTLLFSSNPELGLG